MAPDVAVHEHRPEIFSVVTDSGTSIIEYRTYASKLRQLTLRENDVHVP